MQGTVWFSYRRLHPNLRIVLSNDTLNPSMRFHRSEDCQKTRFLAAGKPTIGPVRSAVLLRRGNGRQGDRYAHTEVA